MTPDVNILVAASRLDHPHHAIALSWLRSCLQAQSQPGPAGLCLLPSVIAGFLRLVTNSRVFADPTPVQQAVGFIDALKPHASDSLFRSDDWPGLKAMLLEKRLTANSIPDAWIAVQVLNRQEMLVTFDRDFRALLPTHHLLLLKP